MRTGRMRSRSSLYRKFATVCAMGCAFALPLGACNLDEEISTTTTVTMSGREVIVHLINAAIFTPLQLAVGNAVDNFFDGLEDDAE